MGYLLGGENVAGSENPAAQQQGAAGLRHVRQTDSRQSFLTGEILLGKAIDAAAVDLRGGRGANNAEKAANGQRQAGKTGFEHDAYLLN